MTLIQPSLSPFAVHRSNSRTVGRKYQSVVIMVLISLFLLGGIASRLAYLQLVQGERNQQLAENNRIRLIPKPPIRGNIFDRKGRVLASYRLSHSVFVWPMVLRQEQWPQTRKRLSQILKIPDAEIQKRLEQAGYNSPYLLRIARGVTPAQVTALAEYSNELQGIEVDIDALRYYPHGQLSAHVLGYTGELDYEELQRRKPDGYRLGDVVGKMGVEKSYEHLLRGEWGGQQVEVDGAGRVVRVLGQKQAQAGKPIHITIDIDVQKAAEAALGDRKGAVVAIDPNTGAVLAMVSRPTFDPNIFSTRITSETWRKLQGRGNPFINRAMRGFPPASTFKVVTASAGMESGRYSPKTVLQTYPYLYVGGHAFGEWNRAGFGPMGFVGAMAWSSNTFFGQIGRGVGGKTLIEWARRYGFGEKTGIELSGESSGLIVDDAWKRKNYNWGWTVGDTINMSIGQGFTLGTPLQSSVMFSAVANGGYRVKPHLLKNNQDAIKGRVSINMKPSTIQTLRRGLRAVVTGGTGAALRVPELPPAAGKSGTAEAPPGKPHAWFGGFAPYDKPEIAVVAFVEHSGGGGGSVAGPIVRQVMEAYFKHK
ncbi:MAG: penicillin-binding protein 2 [Moorea sp. SIO1F2]|nr:MULTISPECIES: penicillin-binding protein 2 [unclassified Moorena]NEO15213.1 penicillin-binding protein 2 [Moorena sp. SIO3E8]NEQ01486.1 penicillin-binding protein 2 [Moorena sp. SIO3F7]NEQ60154.1 penicillin-binding protein 2 [Moorena sp. SIO4A1]NET84611.1 penicillin-binding protein 2 [Moorena sp. SIO1F2]